VDAIAGRDTGGMDAAMQGGGVLKKMNDFREAD
jgi:hypothetical protein